MFGNQIEMISGLFFEGVISLIELVFDIEIVVGQLTFGHQVDSTIELTQEVSFDNLVINLILDG
jgi:hypothetical protein